ncbi:MAG: CPBP family intramembrane glutamic endopeptidase [bacterium]
MLLQGSGDPLIDLDALRRRLGIEQEGGKPFGPFEAGLLVVAALGMVIMHFGGSEQVFLDLWGKRLQGDYGRYGDLHPYFALFGLAHWVGACFLGYAIVPMIYLKLTGRKIRDFYLGFRSSGTSGSTSPSSPPSCWWCGGWHLPDFQRIYPFYLRRAQRFDLIAWGAAHGLQFFALEFFFRGFFLQGLRPVMGYGAIFVMLVPYCMVHFLKTAAESVGSLIAGVVLGTLSMKYRSIWGGVLAHWLVAIAMDVASMLQKDMWPTRFWMRRFLGAPSCSAARDDALHRRVVLAPMAPTRTHRRLPPGSTSAWMGMASLALTPRLSRKGPSFRLVAQPADVARQALGEAGLQRLAVRGRVDAEQLQGDGVPSLPSAVVHRPSRSISATQGTHQVAHRLTHRQVPVVLGASTTSRPGSGRRDGQAKPGPQPPRPATPSRRSRWDR